MTMNKMSDAGRWALLLAVLALAFPTLASAQETEPKDKGAESQSKDADPECTGNDGCEICRDPIPEPLVPLDKENPLGDIAGRMGSVAENLGEGHTGKKVQRKQKEIVSQLDTLIARLRRKAGG